MQPAESRSQESEARIMTGSFKMDPQSVCIWVEGVFESANLQGSSPCRQRYQQRDEITLWLFPF
ncbi:MAG: hypothetical protein VR68_05950 [Peptococcaceae bacterium BRH_c4a]|nr:MAG: hypothetical protein VR68_05950 [Peptococcaceae bacterium BRH_c4a]